MVNLFKFFLPLLIALVQTLALGQTRSPIVLGAVTAQTGPISSLGLDEQKGIQLQEKTINERGGVAGHPLKIIFLDGGGDPQKAVLDVRKLITTGDVVGVICCTTTPASLAVIDTVQRARIPTISLGSGINITEPVSERRWVFKIPPTDKVMIGVEVSDMKKLGIRRLGYLGFNNSLGQVGLQELENATKNTDIKIVDKEQFAPTDTNVAAQASRLVSSHPDAIFITANPPGANIAQSGIRQAGFKGIIYQTFGVTNDTYLRLGGKSINGTRISVLPVTVAEQLPSDAKFGNAVKKFVKDYEKVYDGNTPSSFASVGYDAVGIFAAAIDETLKNGSVQTTDLEAFRDKLRNSVESLGEFEGAVGTHRITATNHSGISSDSINMIEIENGKYKLLKR